jgi:hypothetical protein
MYSISLLNRLNYFTSAVSLFKLWLLLSYKHLYSLSETSLRIRHTVNGEPYERVVGVFSEISGMVILVPAVC